MREAAVKVTQIVRWRLEKFDGEPPQPGELKTPVEVITGGDGIPTVIESKKGQQNATD